MKPDGLQFKQMQARSGYVPSVLLASLMRVGGDQLASDGLARAPARPGALTVRRPNRQILMA